MDTQAPAPASAPSLADFLASVEPLSLFSREELDRLAAQVETRSYAFGDTLCKRGEPAAGLYVIRSGSVRLIAEERGKEMSLGVRKEREVFGEIAMLRDYWHEVSVRASAKTEVLCIPRAALEPLLAANPAAQSFVTSYVAISSAGGFVTRLFARRGGAGVVQARTDSRHLVARRLLKRHILGVSPDACAHRLRTVLAVSVSPFSPRRTDPLGPAPPTGPR